jgi:stage V sporulation protein B
LSAAQKTEPASSEDAASETTRVAGRGGLAITFAKLYFILQGMVQQILLPWALGLDGYGRLSSVQSAASIVYNPIVTTSIQGVSRAVAQAAPGARAATIRRTFTLHGALALVGAVTFFLAAPHVAAFMHAPHLVVPLRMMTGVMLFYGLYAPLVGVLNGSQRFVAQAVFDIVYATARTGALVGGGLLLAGAGRAVEGAVGGFVFVAAGVFVVAALVVGVGKAGPGAPEARPHLTFVAPLFLGQVLLNLLLQADLTLLRRFAGESATAAGLAVTAADPLVGAYRAIQLFSFLPYQILVSVTFILFPMLALAVKQGDRSAISRYVVTGVRVALVVAGLLVSVTSGLSGPLIRLIYSAEAAALGTRAMQVLTPGLGSFAILAVLTASLTSLGKERAGAQVTGAAFVLVVALGFGLVAGREFGEGLLFWTAVSTSLGLLAATLAAALLVYREAGAVVAPLTLVRVLGALAAAVVVGRTLPEGGKIWTLATCGLVAMLYLMVLIVTGELGHADANTVRVIVSRRRSGP